MFNRGIAGTVGGLSIRQQQPLSLCVQQQQVRHASSKRKKRITSYRTDMRRFLGPRNFKGLYTENPFFWTPKNNATNYMTKYTIRGSERSRDGKSHDWKSIFANQRANAGFLQPFSENQYCKSNLLVPEDLKNKIIWEFYSGNTTVQKIGVKYGISIPRIEALVTLDKIEKNYEKGDKITREMGKMSNTMRNMFPILRGNNAQKDDLTEIPVPQETRHQRFINVAESEPFGPIDAAKVLNIEPAADTLERLSTHGNQSHNNDKSSLTNEKDVSFLGAQLDGEKALFKFTNAKAGNVGHRYGASRTDRRHARKVRYTATGQMVYA